jgi:hypothetical protein
LVRKVSSARGHWLSPGIPVKTSPSRLAG